MTDLADRTNNDSLRARFEHLHEEYQRMCASLEDFQRRLAALSGSWLSPDRRIKATVNARGQLIRVELASDVFRRYSPAELGSAITEAVTEAATEVAGAVDVMVTGFLPPSASHG